MHKILKVYFGTFPYFSLGVLLDFSFFISTPKRTKKPWRDKAGRIIGKQLPPLPKCAWAVSSPRNIPIFPSKLVTCCLQPVVAVDLPWDKLYGGVVPMLCNGNMFSDFFNYFQKRSISNTAGFSAILEAWIWCVCI